MRFARLCIVNVIKLFLKLEVFSWKAMAIKTIPQRRSKLNSTGETTGEGTKETRKLFFFFLTEKEASDKAYRSKEQKLRWRLYATPGESSNESSKCGEMVKNKGNKNREVRQQTGSVDSGDSGTSVERAS